MSDYSEFTFTLDNRLAAVSAINDGSAVLATDGISCCVRRICGCRQSDAVGTLRPYRRLRRASDGVGYTAISCEGSRIYRLNDAFCECGYTELESGCGCGCRCGCSDECDYCLTDAMTVSIGEKAFYIGAFGHSAYLFDNTGKRLSKLCETARSEYLDSFISFGAERYASVTSCGSSQTVTVSDGGRLQSALLGRCGVLRMLFAEGEVIYGLFGRNYLYNRIIPIYSQGILTLPTIENQTFSC